MAAQNYLMPGGDPARTSYVPDRTGLTEETSVRWRKPISIGAPLAGTQAVVLDGTVCLELIDAMGSPKEFVGYDIGDGSGSFRLPPANDHASDIGSDGEFVYVCTGARVVAIDPRMGSERWKAELEMVTRQLVVDDGSVYVENLDKGLRDDYVRKIATFESDSGSYQRQTVYRPGVEYAPPQGRLARFDGRTYAIWGSKLVCVDRDDTWEVEIDPSPNSRSLAVTDEGAFVVSESSSTSTEHPALYRIDPVTGTPVWRFSLPGSGVDVAATDDSVIVRADPPSSDASAVVAVDIESGSRRWVNHDCEVTSRLTVVDDTVYAGRRDSRGSFLSAIDLADGTERWRADVDSAIGHHPMIFDGVAVLQCVDELLCLESSTSPEAAAADSAEAPATGTDCPGCGASLDGSERFCPQCGTDLSGDECPQCHTDLDGDERFCPECGNQIDG
jgi:outer membrane protein assembly factor BamB